LRFGIPDDFQSNFDALNDKNGSNKSSILKHTWFFIPTTLKTFYQARQKRNKKKKKNE
jgi:hypothetical protein